MDRKEAIEIIKNNWPESRQQLTEALEFLIPELVRSEDDRMKEEITKIIKTDWPGREYLIKWIEKKCKNKPAWKPTEEQIQILEHTIDHVIPCGYNDVKGKLMGLLAQLRTL